MQKENPEANSVRPIRIRCAKYKFAERSHNFLMQLPMQLHAKGKSSSEFRSPDKNPLRKIQFAERSHNFLMQLPMQLIFGDL